MRNASASARTGASGLVHAELAATPWPVSQDPQPRDGRHSVNPDTPIERVAPCWVRWAGARQSFLASVAKFMPMLDKVRPGASSRSGAT